LQVLKKFYNKTYDNRNGEAIPDSVLTLLWSITVASFALGGMIGGFSAGYLCNRFGRYDL